MLNVSDTAVDEHGGGVARPASHHRAWFSLRFEGEGFLRLSFSIDAALIEEGIRPDWKRPRQKLDHSTVAR